MTKMQKTTNMQKLREKLVKLAQEAEDVKNYYKEGHMATIGAAKMNAYNNAIRILDTIEKEVK